MKKSLVVAGLSALAPSVASAAKAYIPYAYNASIPEVHNKPIAANNGYFYINRPTTAVCPSYDPGCPSRNTTIISGPTYGSIWWMGILEAGGQEIFAEAIARSSVGYAAADSSNYLPYYAEYEFAVLVANSTIDGKAILTINNAGFVACDQGDGSYQLQGLSVYDPKPECQGIQVLLEETEAPAPQYYACAGCETRCSSRYGC